MDFVYVSIFSDCLTCKQTDIGTKLVIGCIGVEGDKAHDGIVKNRGGNFIGSIIIEFVVIIIRYKIESWPWLAL